MANAETSYADRLARGRTMQATIAGFTPVFNPQDVNLAAGAFNSYCGACEGASDDVSTAEADLKDVTDDRREKADAIRTKALAVKDHVGANIAWKKYAAAVGRAADLVRGVALPKKPVAAPPGGGPAPKARMGAKSQQSYADVEKLFGKLIAAVQKITGYAAAAGSGLLVADLTAQRSAYSLANQAVTDAEADLGEKQRTRKEFFEGENGLRDKMKAIKKAVRSQYGASSAEYAAVNVIKV